MADGLRINLNGEDGNVLTRRQGEALAALQHIVSAVYRHETTEGRRLVVDCMGYRQGKDSELRQMAIFLGERAKNTGLAQEIGPLNPYERRIVHLAVSEIQGIDLGEHRRRLREDRHHLGSVSPFGGRRCFPLPTPSSPSPPRRAAADSVWFA